MSTGRGGWQTGAGLALGLGPAVFSSLFAPPVAGLRIVIAAGAVGLVGANCGTVDSTLDEQGAPAGIACAFPFQYDGTVYSSCVVTDADTVPWCATADWHNDALAASAPYLWGYCNASCSTGTEMGIDLDLAAGANPSSGDGADEDDDYTLVMVIAGSVIAMALLVAAVFKIKNKNIPNMSTRATENKLVNVRRSQDTDHTYDLAGNVTDRRGKMASIKGRKTPYEADHDHYDMATAGPLNNDSNMNDDNNQKSNLAVRVNSSAGSSGSEISSMPTEYNNTTTWLNRAPTPNLAADDSELYPLSGSAPSDHFDASGRVASPVTVGRSYKQQPPYDPEAVAKQVAASIDELRKHELTEGVHIPVLTDDIRSAVEVDTVRNAQNQLSTYKRVNEQARGEFAGQKTAFGHDAKGIQTELKAQQEISVIRRVNEQVLSPEAGQQTKVALDAKFMITEMGIQVRINRNSRVNEEITSPYAGASTSYTTTAPQMRAELSQQVFANDAARVNTNFRAGTMTGLKTDLKNHAGMKHAGAQQAAVSQLSRVNEQARGGEFTGASTSYNLDSEGMRNYKRNQGQTSAANRECGLMFGDIGKDGANADAGYHHHEVQGDYLEVGSKFQLSNTMRGRFESMMGDPTDNIVPAERPPSRKRFDMENAPSKEQSTPASNGPSKRMAQI